MAKQLLKDNKTSITVNHTMINLPHFKETNVITNFMVLCLAYKCQK